jgi:ComF family protein
VSWIDDLLSLLFPTFCLHCWRPFSGDAGQPLCEECLSLVQHEEGGRCGCCGQFLGPATPDQADCRNCRDRDFSFDRVYALGRYTPPLQRWIHMMKFENQPVIGFALGKRLGRNIEGQSRRCPSDLIVSIPLTAYREANRWFNQARVIASGVSKVTDIPAQPDTLLKTTSTTPQVELSREERIANISPDVFEVLDEEGVDDQDVLLVDDVMTTGSTLDAAGTVLKRAGASSVQVAVLGR